jgi:RNA polymerase sigma-70 factor (ECF subfamily)
MMSMSAQPDTDLVRAAQAGDVGSFELLYSRYAPVVHSILLGRLPAVDADDVTQNVFITAYTKLSTLRDPAAFAGWIARIARNAAEDHRRRTDDVVELDVDYAARATQADAAEAAHALAAIRQLPEAYRDTLMLRLVEGMSGAEIAERTGLTPGSVRVNLHRGMQLLRDALGGGDA